VEEAWQSWFNRSGDIGAALAAAGICSWQAPLPPKSGFRSPSKVTDGVEGGDNSLFFNPEPGVASTCFALDDGLKEQLLETVCS